jgi:hypothetical protein
MPGVEHGIEVESGADDDPEQEQSQCAEVAQRIVCAAEKQIERLLAAQKLLLDDPANEGGFGAQGR